MNFQMISILHSKSVKSKNSGSVTGQKTKSNSSYKICTCFLVRVSYRYRVIEHEQAGNIAIAKLSNNETGN